MRAVWLLALLPACSVELGSEPASEIPLEAPPAEAITSTPVEEEATERSAPFASPDRMDHRCPRAGCFPPWAADGVQNGAESDVDCGGSRGQDPRRAPQCPDGRRCRNHDDCVSDACSEEGHCVPFRSCTGHHGGDTCGVGETGTPATRHESCCAEANLVGFSRDVALDKYYVTAGRMRAMVERLQGNVRGYIETHRPDFWVPAWTAFLPDSMDAALMQLGPWTSPQLPSALVNRPGCSMPFGGARTYWTPRDQWLQADGTPDAQTYGRDILDEKALNCVPFYLAAAFCAWDGKRLPSIDELVYAWRGGSQNRRFPWGSEAPTATNQTIVHTWGSWTGTAWVDRSSYTFPTSATDRTAHIAAPGRMVNGYGRFGHADLGGLMLPWILDDAPNHLPGIDHNQFAWSYSWEHHEIRDPQQAAQTDVFGNIGYLPTTRNASGQESMSQAYTAIGVRCARTLSR